MMNHVEERLWVAAKGSHLPEVWSLLRDHPGLNVNCTKRPRPTALHIASVHGHVEVVKLLLAHPNINVNVKNNDGKTPFLLGCQYGKVSVVEVLLKDFRVDISLRDDGDRTALWWASSNGHHEVVEWFIASDRNLETILTLRGMNDHRARTALEMARKNQRPKVLALLERFMEDPVQTRFEVCAKLGVLAEVFLL